MAPKATAGYLDANSPMQKRSTAGSHAKTEGWFWHAFVLFFFLFVPAVALFSHWVVSREQLIHIRPFTYYVVALDGWIFDGRGGCKPGGLLTHHATTYISHSGSTLDFTLLSAYLSQLIQRSYFFLFDFKP